MTSDSSAPPSRRPSPPGTVDLDSDTFFSPLPTLHHDPQAASQPVPAIHIQPQPQARPRSPTSPIRARTALPLELVVDASDDAAYRPYTDADVVVISGGSGYNQLVNATPSATYIMPISDNGGSSSEIIRVLGGPSVGDLRSRLVRLIPLPEQDPNHPTPPQPPPPQHCPCAHCGRVNAVPAPHAIVPQSNAALYRLLSYRLPVTGRSSAVKAEWRSLLEGTHKLWRGIEHERREAIRGFLVLFDSEILRRSNRKFNFRGGSIGNFFLAAAQKFFRSIQSAIFLFSAITLINGAGVATGLTFGPFSGGTASAAGTGSRVIPAINTNHTATIAADLRDGETIVGQCEISHPANPSPNPSSQAASPATQQAARYGMFPPSVHARALLTGGLPSSPAGASSPLPHHPHHHHAHHHPAHPVHSHTHSLAGSFVFDPSQPGSGMHTPHTPLGLPHAVGSLTGDGLEIQPHGHDTERGADEGSSDSGSDSGGEQTSNVDPLHAPVSPAGQGLHPLARSISALDVSPAASTPSKKKDKTIASNLVFSKDGEDEPRLSAPIDRVYYVNAYRNVIAPAPNPGYLAALGQASTLVYSCGSLWTSIVPCVALRGVASAIAHSPTLRRKILLLNSAWDRETDGMTAHDFVHALVDSLNSSDIDAGLLGQGVIGSLGSGVVPPSYRPRLSAQPHPHSTDPANEPPIAHTWNAFSGEGYAPTDLINWVVYLDHSQVPIEPHDLTQQTGIRTVRIRVPKPADGRPPKFSEKAICKALAIIKQEEEKEDALRKTAGLKI